MKKKKKKLFESRLCPVFYGTNYLVSQPMFQGVWASMFLDAHIFKTFLFIIKGNLWSYVSLYISGKGSCQTFNSTKEVVWTSNGSGYQRSFEPTRLELLPDLILLCTLTCISIVLQSPGFHNPSPQ